jgi:diguanylate cyclase (GGDEF)-like protein
VQDWSENAEHNNSIARKIGDDMLSYLGVPMLWKDRVIGVISVQCEEAMAFDPHDERLLMALAAQTAMALENARLHQKSLDQGKLDSLTLVYNHDYFVELVRNAVAQSDTDDTQVALIMLDIDHFKHYNDSFGHVAGDNVLKMVAQALKNGVRETDAVGRWGGEEFGILLLGVGITEAKKIARQVRRAISELSPENGHGQILPNPTISQGISSYPYPSATANDLIEEADTALYHAKKHGRNQLVVYESRGGMKDDTTTTGHLTRSRASKDLHVTTDNMRRSRHAEQLEQQLAVTTNDLAPNGEGTNPHLVPIPATTRE